MPDEYADLANHYHLIYQDWPASVRRQGAALDRLIRAELGDRPHTVLDVSCGIGTQALGLALLGHRVHGTDLSAPAVERARREAADLGLRNATFDVADMREVDRAVDGAFDVVLSADNSVAHLHAEADLAQAVRVMRARLVPGGLLIVTLRDYDALAAGRPRASEPRIVDGPEGRRVVLYLHDWSPDGLACDTTILITRQVGGTWTTLAWSTRQRAWRRADVEAALRAAGLASHRWHEPEASGFFQPLVAARRRG